MSLYETITSDIHQIIDAQGASSISPTTIAVALQQRYSTGKLDAAIAYSSLEHFKQMARAGLRRRYGAADRTVEEDQGELFAGKLQDRYPVPTRAGQDPLYKRLEDLTEIELAWNEARFSRTVEALLAHRRALIAFREDRFGRKAA